MGFSGEYHESTMDRIMDEEDGGIKGRNGTLVFGAPNEEMDITKIKKDDDEMGEHKFDEFIERIIRLFNNSIENDPFVKMLRGFLAKRLFEENFLSQDNESAQISNIKMSCPP